MNSKELIRKINLLLAYTYLHEAGVRNMTVAEYNLLIELGEWYHTKGKRIAERRGLTPSIDVLD